MKHYHILVNSSEEQVCQLASTVLEYLSEHDPSIQVKLLSGPRQGLVMLRVRETVANSQFNAGEILVTEVRLELEGQFGFGMIIGDNPRKAMAVALIDAALRKGGPLAEHLTSSIVEMDAAMTREHQRMQALIATTKVDFERM